ncbi:DEAD/DEAH box helicase family protein [bacterium]|nr:DEAD/DEAH box helicase family protein [bacterium]
MPRRVFASRGGAWVRAVCKGPDHLHRTTCHASPRPAIGFPRLSSPFLEVPRSNWVVANALAFAIRDRFPVSPGHTLVIPHRLVASWFEATPEEKSAILDLVDHVKRDLDAGPAPPDGYNVGFNAGEAAGQTVMHLHVHVIPRYRDDVDDPRGGVRHVIPSRGNYLRPSPLATGGLDDPFVRHLVPLFGRATDVAIVAAFIQESGLELLKSPILSALARGARVRILTGDYLNITQADALKMLLDWASLGRWTEDAAITSGALESRVIEVERLEGTTRSFHPKSWRFEGPGLGSAFVGSSNVSRGALATGIEWNLRSDRDRDPAAYELIARAFESLWPRATSLTAEWVAEYAKRARLTAAPLPEGEVELTNSEPPPEPNDLQGEALAELARSRADGRRRALVVLATGLGKTWLSAFDVEAFGKAKGSCPRVLFLAHRAELLDQAARTFRQMFRRSFPDAGLSWFVGEQRELGGDLVLASVQKLSRPENLKVLAQQKFDYVVVDEVHHAAAKSYRDILARLEPRFLLGLTATPDRADEGDVLGLFDDHIAFRADLGVGIHRALLVPFAYHGLKDDLDYTNIPWRNRAFDPTELAAAVQTQARMETLWRAWNKHPASRTLVFCCSIEHARFARDWLRARDVVVRAVHSGEDSDDRETALRDLESGSIQAICTVDLFNEGIDVPRIDRVVMLRPTESPVVFLQQLGRGLRVAGGKNRLLVIDFVGNHRVFLERVRTLISLAPHPTSLRDFLAKGVAPELPPGCSVEVELEAKELLLKLLMPSGRSEVEHAYRELYAARGKRPTAGELCRLGYSPSTLRDAHGSWFAFVGSEKHLSESEARVLTGAREWLEELEKTSMVKSFKMVTLEALLEADALGSGLSLKDLAGRSHGILERNPELLADLKNVKELPDPGKPDPKAWLAYWRKNPIAAWTGEGKRQAGRAWFRVEGERLLPRIPIAAGDEATLADMTRELVDYRLALYRRGRNTQQELGASFACKVISNQRDPILKLPSREHRSDLPTGETTIRLPDGSAWLFRFMKEFVNVAHTPGDPKNKLPDLLRKWFGVGAGRPGTAFQVRFVPLPDGWWVEPSGEHVLAVPTREAIRAFPTLQAAAGAATGALVAEPEADQVRLPIASHGDEIFAVRASGDSMDGGPRPIRDGDWLVRRFARSAGLGAIAGRVALLQVEDEHGAFGYQVKRVVQDGSRWTLRSDNPARPSFPASERTVPIAVLVEVVRPEDIAPAVGSRLVADEVAAKFGLSAAPKTGRVDGHLFVLVETAEQFAEPDRLRWAAPDRRPAETAFVLARGPGQADWLYVGLGRWLEDEQLWSLPALDYATWKAVGAGRDCSRRLEPRALTNAAAFVDAVVAKVVPGSWVEHAGKRCRIVGKAAKGGLRIDGGEGGFQERTVSLADLAWVLVAQEDVGRSGGLLDEARVNRCRYLEGTPKGSTRWIDTGWAITVVSGTGSR